MKDVTVDRRISTRRAGRQSGRRSTDRPASSTASPRCPRCQQNVTILAGEAEGGWWFVCDACDHLWNRRLLLNQPIPQPDVTLRQSGSWLSSAASSCWRFALGRTS